MVVFLYEIYTVLVKGGKVTHYDVVIYYTFRLVGDDIVRQMVLTLDRLEV